VSARRTVRLAAGLTSGLTLVELLVAMAVGLGVLLAAGRLLLLAGTAHAVQGELGAIDDGGRFALELLGRALRQAGVPAQPGTAFQPGPPPVTGLDARSLTRTGAALDETLPDAVNGSDVLAVRYAGAGAAPDGDGSVLDCAGFSIPETKEGWSIFYVARDGDGKAELRCKYRGAANWSADAVVAGVDGFQVLYGLDTDTPPDGAPNRYVNAGALAALDAALPPGQLNEKTCWKRVASVQVALLLHGERPSAAPIQPAAYMLFGPAYAKAHPGDAGVQLSEAELRGRGPATTRRLFTAVFAVGAAQP
jgi:type IV pilus assembly protein PilW